MPCCNNRFRRNIPRPRVIQPIVQPIVIEPTRPPFRTFIPDERIVDETELIRPIVRRDNRRDNYLKAVTLNNLDLDQGQPIPFNFNALEEGGRVTHYPGDSNFLINDDGVYEVDYKLNFRPETAGTVVFALYLNGSPITETYVTESVVAGADYSVSFVDLLPLHHDSTLELVFSQRSTVAELEVCDPILIIRRISDENR